MSISKCPSLYVHVDDADGVPASGYRIYTYVEGSTTPATTFSDVGGTENPNPIILDSAGNATVFLDDSVVYKFEIKDTTDTLFKTVNNITSGDGLAVTNILYVSANDTTGGYLNGKLVAGSNVTLTENNDGGDETLTITTSNDKVAIDDKDSAGYLIDKITASGASTLIDNGSSIDISSTDAKVALDALDTPDYLLNKLIAGNRITLTDNGANIGIGVDTDDIGDTNGSVITVRGRQVYGDTVLLLGYYPVKTSLGGGVITVLTNSGLSSQVNLLNSAFTAPSDGFYFFSFTGSLDTFTAIAGTSYIIHLLHHNGVSEISSDLRTEVVVSDGSDTYPFAISGWLYMSAGDIVQPVCDTEPPSPINDQYQDFIFSVDTSANTSFQSGATWITSETLTSADDGGKQGDKLLIANGKIYTWNGTEWISDGVSLSISASSPVVFKARALSSWEIEDSVSSVTIPFNTANAGTIENQIDADSSIDDGVYTVPIGGFYELTAKASFAHDGANATSITTIRLDIQKFEGGVWTTYGEVIQKIGTNTTQTVVSTTKLELNAGDKIRSAIRQIGDSVSNAVTVESWFEFSGHKL